MPDWSEARNVSALDPESILPCNWYRRDPDGLLVVIKRKGRSSVDYSPVDSIQDGTWYNTMTIAAFCRGFSLCTEDDM